MQGSKLYHFLSHHSKLYNRVLKIERIFRAAYNSFVFLQVWQRYVWRVLQSISSEEVDDRHSFCRWRGAWNIRSTKIWRRSACRNIHHQHWSIVSLTPVLVAELKFPANGTDIPKSSWSIMLLKQHDTVHIHRSFMLLALRALKSFLIFCKWECNDNLVHPLLAARWETFRVVLTEIDRCESMRNIPTSQPVAHLSLVAWQDRGLKLERSHSILGERVLGASLQ